MERYALIHKKFPREFVLLQGTGCRWGKCTFCDYYTDVSNDPFEINKAVLSHVTGQYGVLDVINSGSGIELDKDTRRPARATTEASARWWQTTAIRSSICSTPTTGCPWALRTPIW